MFRYPRFGAINVCEDLKRSVRYVTKFECNPFRSEYE